MPTEWRATVTDDRSSLWAAHDHDWRDPAQIASQWQDADAVERRLLRFRASSGFWELLDAKRICLIVSREYEHLLTAFCVRQDQPEATYMPLPHPSGIAVDVKGKRVFVASTRNPNQIIELRPVVDSLPRTDLPPPEIDGKPLVPARSSFHPGSLYLHDLALIGGRLHGNAVGQNAVVRFGDKGAERVWWPKTIERRGRPDFSRNYLQLNSIAAGSSVATSYYSASAVRPSARTPGHRNFPVDRRGAIFSGRTREPVAVGLTRPHSARFRDGRLWVDNSGYGEIGVVEQGSFEAVARLPGWTRGLAFRDHIAFVGVSRVIPRFRQYAPGLDVDRSVCGVYAVDTRSGATIATLTWPDGNQVFAVECVDRRVATGFPFPATGRRPTRREKLLFYAYVTEGGT